MRMRIVDCGMLGGRYGWVPPGREQSITAAEGLYGVLDLAK
ncbi:MAG: hypothetical protein WCI75_08050 [candidate division NC10 bacterium]